MDRLRTHKNLFWLIPTLLLLIGTATCGTMAHAVPLLALLAVLNLAMLTAASLTLQRGVRERARMETDLEARNQTLALQQEKLAVQQVEMGRTAADLSRANEMFQHISKRFESLFQGLPVASVCYDTDGRIVEWNRAFETLFELEDQPLLFQTVWEALGRPDQKTTHQRLLERICEGESQEGWEWEYQRNDGTVSHILCNTFPLRNAGGEIVGGITIDIDVTARKRTEDQLRDANARLEALATTDSMTGLKNHHAFQERLRQEFDLAHRYHTPLSVVMLDVDHFKTYNDTWGHQAGDQALQQVAALLRHTARETDLPARYGGEEFVVVLPHTDRDGAQAIAERFRAAIAQAQGHPHPITASLGVATCGLSTPTPSQLIAAADTALYASKEAGRNCVTHYADLQPLAHPALSPTDGTRDPSPIV